MAIRFSRMTLGGKLSITYVAVSSLFLIGTGGLASEWPLMVFGFPLLYAPWPYSQLFGPNVVGTAELIRLALTTRLKPITYLSTVAVVNGDVVLGPGSGYGILLTRGTVQVVGNFTWNGLILIIGQGILTWNSGTAGTIYGGLFMAQTRAADGSILPTLSNVAADLTPAAIFYDAAAITAASRSLPYNPIAVKER